MTRTSILDGVKQREETHCAFSLNVANGQNYACGIQGRVYHGTEAVARTKMNQAGTFKHLVIESAAAPAGADTITCALRVNAASKALTCTITGAATTAEDMTHEVVVAKNDLVAVLCTCSHAGGFEEAIAGSLTFIPR